MRRQALHRRTAPEIPVTRDLLELIGVWPGHAPDPTLPQGQSYGIVHGAVASKESGDAVDIAPQDIVQGELGDCYFLSAMAAIARTDPQAIRRLIKDNGDGTYDVTLYVQGSAGWSNKTPQTVRITSEFPMDNHAEIVLPAASSTKHYIVLREAHKQHATFDVSLDLSTATPTCVDNVACVSGAHFDGTLCTCVPDVPPTCVDNVACVAGAHFDATLCTCVPDAP